MWRYRTWNRWLKGCISGIVSMLFLTVCFFALQPVQIESISISRVDTELDIAQSQFITVSILPESANADGIQYRSSDEEILIFSDSWAVGISEGEAEIYVTARDGEIESNRLTVKVTDRERKAREAEMAERLKKFQQDADLLMDAINEIDGTGIESKERLEELRREYDQLPEESKALVLNENILKLAEERLTELEQADRGVVATHQTSVPVMSGLPSGSSDEAGTFEGQPAVSIQPNPTSAPTTENSEDDTEAEQLVYIGRTGTKYHRKDCSTLKENGIAISIEEAKAQGRTACKICKP